MITTPRRFNNPALPKDLRLKDRILAIPSLHRWFQVTPQLLQMNGPNVAQLRDKLGSGALLTQGTADQQAPLVNQMFGPYPGLDLDGVNDEYLLSPSTVDTNSAFTWAVIFKGAVTGQSQWLLSNYVTTNDGSMLGINTAGNVRAQHGNGQAADTHVVDGLPCIAIFGVSGEQIKLKVNRGPTISAATDNNGSTSALRVGRLNSGGSQPCTGIYSDILLFSGDLFADEEHIALLQNFAAAAYGVDLL